MKEAQSLDEIDNKEQAKPQFAKELGMFEINLEKTTNVSKLNDSFKTITPTSVKSERVFSAAGLFITKIQSRMGSKHVNALSTLRSYFCQKKTMISTL